MESFYAVCIAANYRAILVEIDDQKIWVPRSQLDVGNDWEEGDEGTIEVPQWLAENEGLV